MTTFPDFNLDKGDSVQEAPAKEQKPVNIHQRSS